MDIKFPTRTPVLISKRKKTEKRYRGTPLSQKHLKALRRNAVPPGAVLNPYGQCGNTYRARFRAFGRILKPAYREAALKRNRVRMELKKAMALEAHELQQLARENAVAAMRTLIEISRNKRAPEATRIAASAVILDRGYGKSSQTSITANVTNGHAKELTGNELDKRIERALKRVEEVTKRAPEAGTSEDRPTDLRKLN